MFRNRKIPLSNFSQLKFFVCFLKMFASFGNYFKNNKTYLLVIYTNLKFRKRHEENLPVTKN